MGEKLVLASIDLDSTGVVHGAKEGGNAFAGMEKNFEKGGRQAKSTADRYLGALEHRFFGFRHVAGALLGGFTVAGVIIELESLAKELISSTQAWKDFSAGFTDAMKGLAGETPIERIARNAGALMKGAGLASGFQPAADLPALTQAMDAIEKSLAGTPAGLSFGASTQMMVARHILMGDLDTIKRKILDIQKASGLSAFTFDMMFNTFTNDAEKMKVKAQELPDVVEEAFLPKEKIKRATPVFDGSLGPLHDWTDMLATSTTEIKMNQDALQSWGGDFHGVIEEDIKPAIVITTEMAETWRGLNDEFRQGHFEMDALAMGIDAMGAALANAFAGGGKSFKEAMADMMRSLAQMAFVYALWNTALGIMAMTPWGQAIGLGEPSEYFQAAAIFGAVGVAAGLAARALGGGGAAEGGGAANGQGAAAAAATQNQPNLTIVVQGSLLGTTPEQLGRSVLKLVNLGARDMGIKLLTARP